MATKRSQTTWKPGQSGNPAGRTSGAGEIGKLRASIAAHVPSIITTMVSKALEGDAGAARLLLERAIPPIRAVDQTHQLKLPEGTLTEQVAKGDYEVGLQQVAELWPVPGVTYVGKIPEDVQSVTRFAAGIPVNAEHPTQARALLHYLASPEAQPVVQSTGLDSVSH